MRKGNGCSKKNKKINMAVSNCAKRSS